MEVQRSGKHQQSLRHLLAKLEEAGSATMDLLDGGDEENAVIFDKAPRMTILAEEGGLRITIPQWDEDCWCEVLVSWREIVREIGDFYVDGVYENKEARLRVLEKLEKEIGLMRAELGPD